MKREIRVANKGDRYMVGSNNQKDRYAVGTYGQKDVYKVGGGGAAPGESDNKALVAFGAGDPVVESKSQFKYPYNTDATTKDIGDRGDNTNVSGAISNGIDNMKAQAGAGEISLVYSEKGNWDESKDAMARRKELMDNKKRYFGNQSEYQTPTPDIVPDKSY